MSKDISRRRNSGGEIFKLWREFSYAYLRGYWWGRKYDARKTPRLILEFCCFLRNFLKNMRGAPLEVNKTVLLFCSGSDYLSNRLSDIIVSIFLSVFGNFLFPNLYSGICLPFGQFCCAVLPVLKCWNICL